MTKTQGCDGRVPVRGGFQAATGQGAGNLIQAPSHKSWTNDLSSSLPAWAVPWFYDSVQTGTGSCSHVHQDRPEEGISPAPPFASKQTCMHYSASCAHRCPAHRRTTPRALLLLTRWAPDPIRPREAAPASCSGPKAMCGW